MTQSIYYVDPAIAADSGAGTISDPYGDLQYALNTITRDATNGDKILIKSGIREQLSSPLSLMTYGTTTSNTPLTFKGYTATEDDGGIGEIDCSALYSLFASTSYSYIQLISLEIHNFGTAEPIHLKTGCTILNCEIHSSTHGSYIIDCESQGFILGNHIHSHTSGTIPGPTNALIHASSYSGGTSRVIGNFIEAGDRTAIYSGGKDVISDNVVTSAMTANQTVIQMGSFNNVVCGNSIYCSAACTGFGISLSGTGQLGAAVFNNYVEGISGVGGKGISMSNLNNLSVYNNRTFNCTSNAYGNGFYIDDNDTLAASAFTNAPGGDFSIIDNVLMRGVAWPTAFGTNMVNAKDIGAVQSRSGGGMLRIVQGGGYNG